MNRSSRAALLATTLLGCVSLPSLAQAQGVDDPFEPVNRGIFAFNEVLDNLIVKPIATVYNAVLPKPVRTGVSNVFGNLDDVFIGANHALQGRGKDAANSFGRVVINTTFGVGGLVDLASMNGMPKGEGDYGQTLGVWGVGPGPYIVLPVLGPSNARDTVGRAARVASDPRTYMPDAWSYSLRGVESVQIRADNLENTRLIDSSSLDKYGFTRSLYMQRRDALVKSGKAAASGP
jgi:phospholipid-binding lipoprotein MlaA